MKKINDILFSMTTSVILLLLFAISIGYATFIENNDGTETARKLVYNAVWFETLLALLIINLSGSIIRYDILNKRKLSILLFHFAFIVILIGAAITRYIGSEGIMHIREGETSNEFSSSSNSIRITAEINNKKTVKTSAIDFSPDSSTDFSEELTINDKSFQINKVGYVPNAIETITSAQTGEAALALFIMGGEQNGGQELILSKGDSKQVGSSIISFGDSTQHANIQFFMQNKELFFKSSLDMSKMSMLDQSENQIKAGTTSSIAQRTIFKTPDFVFVLKAFYPIAKKEIIQFEPETSKMAVMREKKNALIFTVSDGKTTQQMNILSSEVENSSSAVCTIDNVKITIDYGMLAQKLPFSIQLLDFQLDRYPGSNSPSSYASEIKVIDPVTNTETPYRIFMNNILNHKGYRFFQSSYDQDERGTILSVNHDFWGTNITYVGYFLLMLGMVLTLFNKNSRFRKVIQLSNELQQKRRNSKLLILALLITFASTALATNPAKEHHLKALNTLLIQDEAQGRIEPFSTFASDVFRKISKKSKYGNLTNTEVILGMITDPAKWENERIIKVGNELLADELGAINGYVSFSQLFDPMNNGTYRLSEKVNNAYQKEQSARNKYETEIIYVDERINICYQLFEGELLHIFPDPTNVNAKWLTPDITATETPANMELNMQEMASGMMGTSVSSGKCPAGGMSALEDGQQISPTGKCPAGGDMQTPANSQGNSLTNYKNAVIEAYQTGNWTNATSQLASLKEYQLQNGKDSLPSESKISLEILYNNINVFGWLGIVYILLGMFLLSVHIYDIFKPGKTLQKIIDISIYPFGLSFAIYTLNLAARWYISDHAPWSNGYEAMIFVGWATTLAGLLFAQRSVLALAVTGILSAIALFTAGMSWMNPEITNLVPVLKSYWLIVHVAVITSSYGFLAMGAMLGLLNLTLMIARSSINNDRLNSNIQEISYIIELSLTVGLFMLTVGCFLGGVWANESWGRYWGWDPKETWALVCILVYSAILHLRSIPKLNNQFALNSLALLGFGSVIMAFLGVNYYLSGMHSYGQGTAPETPSAVYVIIVALAIIIGWAYKAEKKNFISE